jgi:transposase
MMDRTLQSERLGPLPLINHFIQRIGLEDILHRYVPSDARCTVPNARALGVLLRSIIVEREPIYRQQETVQAFASGMFGIAAEEMEHLGDDRIGRALDRLFDADRAALLTAVVVAVGQRFNVRFDEFHNDSTSISFCGSYRAASGRTIRGRTAPAITYGFSKDHRPDLKQLLLILTMCADGNVPFEQIKTVHEIAPVFLKNEGRIEALFTLYFLALLVQALIERELRLAMKREKIAELPLYPEQRLSAHPTTEQILGLFSLAQRHKLIQNGKPVQVFDVDLTDLQRQVLVLLGVSEQAFQP